MGRGGRGDQRAIAWRAAEPCRGSFARRPGPPGMRAGDEARRKQIEPHGLVMELLVELGVLELGEHRIGRCVAKRLAGKRVLRSPIQGILALLQVSGSRDRADRGEGGIRTKAGRGPARRGRPRACASPAHRHIRRPAGRPSIPVSDRLPGSIPYEAPSRVPLPCSRPCPGLVPHWRMLRKISSVVSGDRWIGSNARPCRCTRTRGPRPGSGTSRRSSCCRSRGAGCRTDRSAASRRETATARAG